MNQNKNYKKDIISIGHLLWEKDLVSGVNGNISVRVDEHTFAITAHKTCLGLLNDKDILLVKTDGSLMEEGKVSTEKLMHTEIYANLPEVNCIIHTHTNYVNAYFLDHNDFSPEVFESKIFLGSISAIDQNTPAVTDVVPLLGSLKNNNICVLRKHGIVSIGKELFDCFLLIQSLEDAIKIAAIRKAFQSTAVSQQSSANIENKEKEKVLKKYKLFSTEQIDAIVELVNSDSQFNELGKKTNMIMELAVKLNESDEIFSFNFENGKIKDVGKNENAEFMVSAPEKVWRAVFNREIDPFVATTQKKMDLKGDFAKISRWYSPCSRVFELWAQVPVE